MVQFSVVQSRVGLLSLQIAAILCLFWGIAVYAQAPLEDRNGGVGRVVIGDCLAIAFLDSNHPSSQPMQAAVERAIENGWVIRQVDVRKEAYAAERYRVHTTPTVILLRGGREVDRILGAIPFDEFSQRLVRASSADSLKTLDGSKASIQPLVPMQQRPTQQIVSPTSPQGSSKLIRDPMAATVRILVDDPTQQAIGSGTIIDCREGRALVLTCGHLFRDRRSDTQITVEVFDRGGPIKYRAELLDAQIEDVDIGLIAFRPSAPVPVAAVVDRGRLPQEGASVFSVGCDHGQNPSRRDSRVTRLNRYLGAPNIEASGMPVQGRSGGGLFNSEGELVGVCFAADSELDEGLYCGTEVIHAELNKVGLSHLVEARSVPGATAAVATAPTRMVVVLMDPNGGSKELTITSPSPQLLDAVQLESQRTLTAASAGQNRQ